ncbi:Fe-S cluster assembly protein HesB [bacterium]|nr:Fe-S cluster assembly protein HesB [bacterium]
MTTQQIQTNILERYAINGRQFPRRETTDPYAIHICETMSQQTQLSRVLPYRTQRMQDIPNYEALANLSKIDLLKHRSGLGFNSRALRLQACAKIITETLHGELPHSREELLKLPGIGPYTASAICAFARNLPEPIIDTNIRRVLIFLLKLPEEISIQQLEKEAKKLIPTGKSRDRHNALMDYGATILTAKSTNIRSISKQSKFEGSDREVRGWILKQLVKSSSKTKQS